MTVPDPLPPGHRPDYRLGHDYCNFPPQTGLHSCGNNTALMEELIDDVGIDRGRLATMPVAEFRPWCRGVLDACMDGGRYALGTGNSPATCVRRENFYAMHEVGFAHGRYGGTA